MNKYKIQTEAYLTVEAEDMNQAISVFQSMSTNELIYGFEEFNLKIGKGIVNIKKI